MINARDKREGGTHGNPPVPPPAKTGAQALEEIQRRELVFVNTLSDVEVQLECMSKALLELRERLLNVSIALREIPELTELRIRELTRRLESKTVVS